MKDLTNKQKLVLKFIENYQFQYGRSPTIKEMKVKFKVSSDNSILKHLKALQKKGFIVKDESARGIQLLEKVKKRLNGEDKIKLPVLGSIPAGGPVGIEEYAEDFMEIGSDLAGNSEDFFLLRVTGESMINAGILEDDLVLVNTKKKANSGDIVVALVDNENTLKRFIHEGGKSYLKAENPDYPDIYPQNSLEIQGVVVSLIRQYS